MSIRIKGAIWFSTAALLIGTVIFFFIGRQSLELLEIATDIAMAAVVAIIAGIWGFKYAIKIAKSATAIRAFAWGCLFGSVSLITFGVLLWLVFVIGGIIGWITKTGLPSSSVQSFSDLVIGLLFMLSMILFVSFNVAFMGIVFAGIASWLFWLWARRMHVV